MALDAHSALVRALLRTRLGEDHERGHNGRFRTVCWLYEGALNGDGYGVINLGGRGEGNVLAHRLTYQELVGPIPEGLTLDHLCRVHNCVRPNHLEPVTQAVNASRVQRYDGLCKRGLHQITGGRCRPCKNDYMRSYNRREKENA